MSIYVFTGPTLSPEEAADELDAIYLPPVSQGDVYRASLRRPQAIGIIDGYFERVPSVWHKEILWAMSEGIHVFGSASMGALRAAELAAFGMEGVGAIFEAYCDGVLEDDDEVAVAHGSAETGYRELSEAMVNIRRTLASAAAAQILSTATRLELERIAKHLFYPERSFSAMLRQAEEQGLPRRELEAFHDWLPQGRVDQKREDALAMLRVMRERLCTDSGPKRVRYAFEHTDMWDTLICQAGELHSDPDCGEEVVLLDRLLDELRLDRDTYTRALQGAMARLMAIEEARREGLAVTTEALQDTTDMFRRERDLLEPEDVERWLAEHHLSWDQFTRLMEDEVRRRWVEALAKTQAMNLVPDYLRVTGEYTRLLSRARDKEQRLESCGLPHPGLADAGVTGPDLLRWYFEEHLGRPKVEDAGRHAEAIGFADEDAFMRALLREFCYLQPEHVGRSQGGTAQPRR